MPNTYSQLYVQLIFAVKGRLSLINPSWETDLYKYITGIVKNQGHKLLAINGMPDHIHILISLSPTCTISNLVMEIKKASNKYINTNNFSKGKFAWQEGFGAFSYSQSALKNVISYIENQKEHHSKTTFQSEYKDFLVKFNIDFKEEYLFEPIENVRQ
jgi:putative transposase